MDNKRDLKLNGFTLKNFKNLNVKESRRVWGWRNCYRIRKHMYNDGNISWKEHSLFLSSLKKNNNSCYWLVRGLTGDYLGVVYLNRIDRRNGNAYLGIYSNPYNLSRGFGIILMELLKLLAFDVYKIHTLKLEVLANNKKAINFYKRSGFKAEGRLKDFVLRSGRRQDVVIMGIINKYGPKK